MDACQRHDWDCDWSFLDEMDVLREFFDEKLAEPQINEPEATSWSTINAATVPFLQGSATIFEDENELPDFSRRPGFPNNMVEMGRSEPQITIPSLPGPSSTMEYEPSNSCILYPCQNQPSCGITNSYQGHQQSSSEVPCSDPIGSSFGFSYSEGNQVSDWAPSFHQNQLPLVDTSYVHRVQSGSNGTSSSPELHRGLSFHQNQLPMVGTTNVHRVQSGATSTSSFPEICWDSIGVSSHQSQPSLGNLRCYQSETLLGVSRENDHHFAAEASNISAYTPHASLTVPSIGFLPPSNDDQYSTLSTTSARLSCESRFKSYLPMESKPLSQVDMNGSDNVGEHCCTNIDEKSSESNEFDEEFNPEFILKSHVHPHALDEKLPFECDKYHREFAKVGHLKTHIHAGEKDKPFKCDRCDKKFSAKEKLKWHYEIHTGERPYKCNICEKKFKRSGHLKEHYRVHSGERPFKCDVCDEEFSFHGNLKRHCRIHTGDQPYKCNICDQKFNQNCNLKKHYRVHSGEKPFRCDRCYKEYFDKGCLKKHYRIHTGEQPFAIQTSTTLNNGKTIPIPPLVP